MNNLTTTLLGGVALAALTAVPATAQHKHPAFSFTALHAGRVVNKTKLHNHGAMHLTYTFGVYTYISADLHKKVPLAGSFYKWNSYSTICSSPKDKIKFPKKSEYGKFSKATETFSLGCPSGPTVFTGVDFKPASGGSGTDTFVIIHLGTFRNDNGKYKGTLNLDMNLTLE